MGTPYIGEIRIFAGNFAPAGWAFCHGQLLAIANNDALFTLIGTTYGGDGQTTFALPDLRGRLPVHQGSGPGLTTRIIGETGGVETVTLTQLQLPSHRHAPIAMDASGTSSSPIGNVWAIAGGNFYSDQLPGGLSLPADTISSVGGNQPHSNLMPYLCINFIIALLGIFPPQN